MIKDALKKALIVVTRRAHEIVEDEDKTLSASKLGFLAALIVVLWSGVYITLKTHQMADWGSGTMLTSSLLAVRKGADALRAHIDNKKEDQNNG
jgi:hypothetical protein